MYVENLQGDIGNGLRNVMHNVYGTLPEHSSVWFSLGVLCVVCSLQCLSYECVVYANTNRNRNSHERRRVSKEMLELYCEKICCIIGIYYHERLYK